MKNIYTFTSEEEWHYPNLIIVESSLENALDKAKRLLVREYLYSFKDEAEANQEIERVVDCYTIKDLPAHYGTSYLIYDEKEIIPDR